jgi:hypothetical protein
MVRKLLGTLIVLVGLAAVPTAAGALGASTPVRVSPGSGGIHTDFKLRFTIPDATGMFANVDRSDSISVNGPSRQGCVGQTELPLHSAAAGTAFQVRLNPAHLDGHWCTGTFRGMLMESQTPICEPVPVQIVCPDYELAPQVLGRFTFHVKHSSQSHKKNAA